jgi:nitrite reductase/ring-hydroxylating ferredoxin subunit
MYFHLLIFISIFNIVYLLRINTKPHVSRFGNQLPLYWKIANVKEISSVKPKRFVFDEYPVTIYKDKDNSIIAISDICVHRGASLAQGKILPNGCIQCPYHGWEYKNGLLQNIPGIPGIKSNFGVPRYDVQELNDDVYIRPTFDINSKKGGVYNHTIYVPPEASDESFVRISGYRHIMRPNNMITENVLDMMHISYVHSFGNSFSPVPFKLEYEDVDDLSGRTTFHYTAGATSMSKLIGGATYVEVENEFHLPDATVTRVKANDITKTIITHCYPIGKNESILYYDLYRNFFTSPIFDGLFEYQMRLTLDEDVDILNRIYDDYYLGFMSTKFDITQTKYRGKMNTMKKKLTDDEITL